MERTKYEIKGKRGIDDLLSLYAFSYNDGGGASYTNNIATYKESDGWWSFNFDCELTDEAIAKEIERRKEANERYVSDLFKSGEYGKEYITTLELEYNPALDGKQVFPNGPLESYRLVFLDFQDDDGNIDPSKITFINPKDYGKPESNTKEEDTPHTSDT